MQIGSGLKVTSKSSIRNNFRNFIESFRDRNPELEFHPYNEAQALKFIEDHYPLNVSLAFKALVPRSYKSDLFRYCILHIMGGIYIDIKYRTPLGVKLINYTHKEYFVMDGPYPHTEEHSVFVKKLKMTHFDGLYSQKYLNSNRFGVYTALIIAEKGNAILKECIDRIVINVQNQDYSLGFLYVTGPGLLGQVYTQGNRTKIYDFELFHNSRPDKVVLSKDGIIKELLRKTKCAPLYRIVL